MSRALFVCLCSLSSFSKKNLREFSGVLGALPLGEGVAENAVVELVETSAVGARQYVVSSICRNVDLAAKLVR